MPYDEKKYEITPHVKRTAYRVQSVEEAECERRPVVQCGGAHETQLLLAMPIGDVERSSGLCSFDPITL